MISLAYAKELRAKSLNTSRLAARNDVDRAIERAAAQGEKSATVTIFKDFADEIIVSLTEFAVVICEVILPETRGTAVPVVDHRFVELRISGWAE